MGTRWWGFRALGSSPNPSPEVTAPPSFQSDESDNPLISGVVSRVAAAKSLHLRADKHFLKMVVMTDWVGFCDLAYESRILDAGFLRRAEENPYVWI